MTYEDGCDCPTPTQTLTPSYTPTPTPTVSATPTVTEQCCNGAVDWVSDQNDPNGFAQTQTWYHSSCECYGSVVSFAGLCYKVINETEANDNWETAPDALTSGWEECSCCPTETHTVTSTATPTATDTHSITLTSTPTATHPTPTATPTATATPTPTATATPTPTATATPTATPTPTATATATSPYGGGCDCDTADEWMGPAPAFYNYGTCVTYGDACYQCDGVGLNGSCTTEPTMTSEWQIQV